MSGLKSVSGSCVTLNDGSTLTIDDVIFCTGYKYTFDFLSSEYVQVEGDVVKPLYRQLVSINYPDSLFFVGLNFLYRFACLTFVDREAQIVKKLLNGDLQLPSIDEMKAESEAELAERATRGNEWVHIY